MNRTWGMAVLVMAGLIGCQSAHETISDPLVSLQSTPDDAAMELRDDWQTVAVEYPNGGIVSGPTLYPLTSDSTRPTWQQPLIEPLLFVGQTVILPVTIFTTPGTTVSQGVDFPDTDTAVLPLPASDVQAPRPIPDRRATATGVSQTPDVTDRQVPEAVPQEDVTPRDTAPRPVTPRDATPSDVTPRDTTPRDAAPRVVDTPPATQPELNK